MDDRELLEKVAKIAGIEIVYCIVYNNYLRKYPAINSSASGAWNPLIDDGDALRLAVSLGINIPIMQGEYSATRRAIVRAAAEIGKQKETE